MEAKTHKWFGHNSTWCLSATLFYTVKNIFLRRMVDMYFPYCSWATQASRELKWDICKTGIKSFPCFILYNILDSLQHKKLSVNLIVIERKSKKVLRATWLWIFQTNLIRWRYTIKIFYVIDQIAQAHWVRCVNYKLKIKLKHFCS